MSNSVVQGCGFHHVAMYATDFDATVDFYEKIGFRSVLTWGEGNGRAVMMDIGDGGCLEIFSGTGNAAEGCWIHFAVKVDDAVAAYNTAMAAGAVSHTEPLDAEIMAATGGVKIRIAFVKGLNGEVLEFFQYR